MLLFSSPSVWLRECLRPHSGSYSSHYSFWVHSQVACAHCIYACRGSAISEMLCGPWVERPGRKQHLLWHPDRCSEECGQQDGIPGGQLPPRWAPLMIKRPQGVGSSTLMEENDSNSSWSPLQRVWIGEEENTTRNNNAKRTYAQMGSCGGLAALPSPGTGT